MTRFKSVASQDFLALAEPSKPPYLPKVPRDNGYDNNLLYFYNTGATIFVLLDLLLVSK